MGKKRYVVSKSNIVKEIVSSKAGPRVFSQRETDYIVTCVFNSIVKHVKNDERVVIKGFGTFEKAERKARLYTTPTGQVVRTEDKSKMSFTPSYKVTDEFNSKNQEN